MTENTQDGTAPTTARRRRTWAEMFATPTGRPRNRAAEAIIVVAIVLMVSVTLLQAFGYVPHTSKFAHHTRAR